MSIYYHKVQPYELFSNLQHKIIEILNPNGNGNVEETVKRENYMYNTRNIINIIYVQRYTKIINRNIRLEMLKKPIIRIMHNHQ